MYVCYALLRMSYTYFMRNSNEIEVSIKVYFVYSQSIEFENGT